MQDTGACPLLSTDYKLKGLFIIQIWAAVAFYALPHQSCWRASDHFLRWLRSAERFGQWGEVKGLNLIRLVVWISLVSFVSFPVCLSLRVSVSLPLMTVVSDKVLIPPLQEFGKDSWWPILNYWSCATGIMLYYPANVPFIYQWNWTCYIMCQHVVQTGVLPSWPHVAA